MTVKYDLDFPKEVIVNEFNRIMNRIFRLLPEREENGQWEVQLQNIIVDIIGMREMLPKDGSLFLLMCKLEALKTPFVEDEQEDFRIYRKIIFECLELCSKERAKIEEGEE
jgi:hypothetical protein